MTKIALGAMGRVLFQSLLIVIVLASTLVAAQAAKRGHEFRVNTLTEGVQWAPSVATLTDGGFVVVSESWEANGHIAYGQRYTADGRGAGRQIRVDTSKPLDQKWQRLPKVAGLSSGGFVITWQSSLTNAGPFSTRGQSYTNSGDPVGGQFIVQGSAERPSIGSLSDGGFVITWVLQGSSDVYGQRYTKTSSPIGGPFPIGAADGSTHQSQVTTGLADGGFIEVWNRSSDIYGQRYSRKGVKAGTEFLVHSGKAGWALLSVSSLANGDFVIAWALVGEGASGVHGRRYNSSGASLGKEFLVTSTDGRERQPAVASLTDGAFVILWDGPSTGDNFGVSGQRYDAAGGRVWGQFLANTYTLNAQYMAAAAGQPNDGFVVVWASELQDGSEEGIYGQRFRH